MSKKRIASLCFELQPPSAVGAAMPLLPTPDQNGRVQGVDGRAWTLKNREGVLKAWTRRRAITENHARILAAPKGLPAPAFGWITAIAAAADGSIEFVPDWNPRGQAAIDGRDYLYLSPEFEHDDAGNILAIVGAGLTNDPNFPQLALNSEQEPELSMLKEIALALGLPEDADVAAILDAIKAMKSKHETALNAAAIPDPTKFVTIELHQVALNRASTAETTLKTLQDKERDARQTALIDDGIKAGKIVPANRDFYLSMCRTEGGEEKLKAFLATQPVIADPKLIGQEPPKTSTALNAEQKQAAASLGLTEEEYLKGA